MDDLFIIPVPESFEFKRLALNFGLRSAQAAHRNQVVYGLGSVRYLRQISWSLAAIYLYTETMNERERRKYRINASAIAHGIEALVGKSTYFDNLQNSSEKNFNYIGVRAFTREYNEGIIDERRVWSFGWLRQPGHYVHSNTFRQETTSALSDLGLTEGSTRFNLMRLSPKGRAVAMEFVGQRIGKETVLDYLANWVKAGDSLPFAINGMEWAAFVKALAPNNLTEKEKELYRNLFKDAVLYNGRLLLYQRMPRCGTEEALYKDLKKAGERDYCTEIDAARCFESLQKAIRDFFLSCVEQVRKDVCKFADLEKALATKIRSLRDSARAYAKFGAYAYGRAEAARIIDSDFRGIISYVLDGNRAMTLYRDSVQKGPLFASATDLLKENYDEEDIETAKGIDWPLQRLRQWRNLCVECGVCK